MLDQSQQRFVVLDDVAAGIYAAATLRIYLWLLSQW